MNMSFFPSKSRVCFCVINDINFSALRWHQMSVEIPMVFPYTKSCLQRICAMTTQVNDLLLNENCFGVGEFLDAKF